MAYNTVTVTSSATRILASPSTTARNMAIVTNTGTGTVYIGFDSSVTTSNGFPIGENDVWETNEPRCFQGEVWGVVASGTSDVRYWELL